MKWLCNWVCLDTAAGETLADAVRIVLFLNSDPQFLKHQFVAPQTDLPLPTTFSIRLYQFNFVLQHIPIFKDATNLAGDDYIF